MNKCQSSDENVSITKFFQRYRIPVAALMSFFVFVLLLSSNQAEHKTDSFFPNSHKAFTPQFLFAKRVVTCRLRFVE